LRTIDPGGDDELSLEKLDDSGGGILPGDSDGNCPIGVVFVDEIIFEELEDLTDRSIWQAVRVDGCVCIDRLVLESVC
jgi:hypothetical protein